MRLLMYIEVKYGIPFYKRDRELQLSYLCGMWQHCSVQDDGNIKGSIVDVSNRGLILDFTVLERGKRWSSML